MFFRTALAMVLSAGLMTYSSSSVRADEDPIQTTYPKCETVVQQYCVESLVFKPTVGATVTYEFPTLDDPNSPTNTTYVAITDHRAVTNIDPMQGPNAISFVLNYLEKDDQVLAEGLKPAGFKEGAYTMTVRIGEYDPTLFKVDSFLEKYSSSKDANGNWRIEATMRPAVVARPADMANDCGIENWAAECEYALAEANLNENIKGYIQMINNDAAPNLVTAGIDPLEDLRGIWVSTNAYVAGIPVFNAVERSFSVNAAGPHYLPTDYGLPVYGGEKKTCEELGLDGKVDTRAPKKDSDGIDVVKKDSDGNDMVDENNNPIYEYDELCINPGFFAAYMPYRALAVFVDMPTDIMKEFFTADAITAIVGAKEKSNIKIYPSADGVKIDFNIEHFSQPNPKLKVKAASSLKGGAKVKYDKVFKLPKNAKIKSLSVTRQTKKSMCSIVDKKYLKAAKKKTGYCVVKITYKVGKKTFIKKAAVKVSSKK